MSEIYQTITIKFNSFSETEYFHKCLDSAFMLFEDELEKSDFPEATEKAINALLSNISNKPLDIHLNKENVIKDYETLFMEYSGKITDDELEITLMNGEWFWEKMIPLLINEGLDYVFSTFDIAFDEISVFALIDKKLEIIYEFYNELGMDDEIMDAENRHEFVKNLFDTGKIGVETRNVLAESEDM